MKRSFILILAIIMTTIILFGCNNSTSNGEIDSDDTLSDQYAEEQNILSKDDAEALVYNQLNDEEKEKLTIDYYKEEGTKYFIRVYEEVNGSEKVIKEYTVDFNTEEVQEVQ
ncbi:hypothetical protein [Jeotgalibacillus sp. JSM ZJ347]|uniref:hypothetical protein n=1 Tax=Jeotgalibacillus sp. JSM ZJ347 TaxID=3342117 RepID=UPI0035A8574F